MYQAANDRYEKMAYVRCGKSGLKLPAISLGLWHNFGDTGVYENMKEILFTAFDNGIVHFDLANNYGPAYGSAEKNFGKILKEEFLKEKELAQLEKEFYVDDHKYWANQQPDRKPNPLMSKKWGDISEGIETDLETFSRGSGEQDGDFLDQLKIENRERYDYREFLRKFAVFREELTVDPDSFDYNFYTYGLSLYGNMPLIEPLETREMKKVSEFVIVIDTSMSCSGELVQRFLEETYGILSDSGNFFQKVNIHIIQCDEKVHSDVKITGAEELQEYMNSLELYGDGGTDFRPAFAYVEELMEKREFENLKGLVYFTDGYGLFPAKMPPYRTAFVFMEQEPEDVDIPAWAMKLVITEEEL